MILRTRFLQTVFLGSLFASMLTAPICRGVTLSRVFGDRMVLQRDANVPIWGDALAGAKITIDFADQTIVTQADNDGHWRTTLDPMPASAEPQTLLVTSDKDEPQAEFKDVLLGDVWVGSGQSNMAGRVASYAKNDETLAALANKELYPHIRLANGSAPVWKSATSAEVAQFSALLFAFGERLHRDLDVPIGLIVGAVGGTPSGSWIPPQTFADSRLCRDSINEFAKNYDREAAMKRYQTQLQQWEKQAAKAKAEGKNPRGRKPQPPAAAGQSSRGGKIGGLYQRHIQPVVGYRIRGVLWDQGEARSGVVGVAQFTMMTELIRGWREAWGQGDFPFLFVQKPSGGGCAFSKSDPITRNGDALVSLPAEPPQVPTAGGRATIDRYMYVRLMQTNDDAWMVPVSDLGGGIHPTNKWGYGNRAAEVALSKVYGKPIQAYGPIYKSLARDGKRMVLSFDEVGKGLTAAHSEQLQGFAIAGADDQWHWAEAKIEGDKVVVWSSDVPKPERVRYAFAAKRSWANLFNKDGRPALAFQTE